MHFGVNLSLFKWPASRCCFTTAVVKTSGLPFGCCYRCNQSCSYNQQIEAAFGKKFLWWIARPKWDWICLLRKKRTNFKQVISMFEASLELISWLNTSGYFLRARFSESSFLIWHTPVELFPAKHNNCCSELLCFISAWWMNCCCGPFGEISFQVSLVTWNGLCM